MFCQEAKHNTFSIYKIFQQNCNCQFVAKKDGAQFFCVYEIKGERRVGGIPVGVVWL